MIRQSGKKQIITACVFIYKKGKVLVAKRAKTKKFLPGKYELPGGHIEFGETIEDGLIREIDEEFHIGIRIGDPYYIFTYVYKNEHVVEIEYFAEIKNKNQKIRINQKDHSEYKWITEQEIEKYFSDNDLERRALKRGFKIWKKFYK
ncbi:MAG: NUDIX domain-containing protein [Patescibacteria group bacterium]|nr:NUDIX domain-containing protein [Patescibacteria group bacterium]